MKRFKISKLGVMALGMLITAALFLLGHNGHEHVALATTAAALSLTDEEKSGLDEKEAKFLLAVKKMADQMNKDATKGLVTPDELQKQVKEFLSGLTSVELKGAIKEIETLQETLKAQGVELAKLKAAPQTEETIQSFEEAWKKNLAEIKKIRRAGAGFKAFYFGDVDEDNMEDGESKENTVTGLKSITKVAGVTSVTNVTSSTPANVTNPYSPFPQQNQEIIAVRRNPNFALNYVDRGSTNSAVITWTEEGNSEGDAAIVAEGALKPLQDKKFTDRLSKAKKEAGHVIITEEMENDTPRIATAVRRLFEENVMRKYDDQVWADIIAIAPGYTSTALDDQIENADDFGAIGAAFSQLESLNAMPDVICINPADKWRLKLTKGSDGHYVTPPFTAGDKSFEGVQVVTSNKVAAGFFLVAELKKYKVDEYKPFSLRVGWQNDDLVKNQFTIVGEVRFHSYVATNDLVGFCYAQFATVKAQIEKP